MAFRSEVSREAKYRERRRGVRLNSKIPIAVEWRDDGGASVRIEAHTRVVSPTGCLVVLPYDLPLDQRLRVTNLANSGSSAAQVVWRGKRRLEGFELGLELIKPEWDFWGLDL